MTAIDLPKISSTVAAMTDISKLLPENSPVVDAIYAYHKKRGDLEQSRQYLGMSEIGGPCERALWYQFRQCCKPTLDGRLYRLFETGNLAESRFVTELRAIGCTVHDVDESGNQFAFSELGGHFSGHMDGCAIGIPGAEKTWVVLEFKTHNAKSFAKLKKEGVKAAKPQHWAQCQCYMRASGMTRALYLACNKDTDDLYAERVHFDPSFASGLIDKAQRIVTSTTPPERAFTRPDYFECQWCDAKRICWGDPVGPAFPVPSISCRQCCHATPIIHDNETLAPWVCEKHKRGLSVCDQAKACDDHLVLPGLIGFATPLDYDDGCIIFNGELSQWKHGKGGFSTKELTILPARQLVNPLLNSAKEEFGATAAGFSASDILARYPEDLTRIAWKGALGLLKTEWQRRYKTEIEKIEPIAKCEGFNYRAAEFPGQIAVIVWTDLTQIGASNCEIREGIE